VLKASVTEASSSWSLVVHFLEAGAAQLASCRKEIHEGAQAKAIRPERALV